MSTKTPITVRDLKTAVGCYTSSNICNGDNEMIDLVDPENSTSTLHLHKGIEQFAIKNDICIRVFYSIDNKEKIFVRQI